ALHPGSPAPPLSAAPRELVLKAQEIKEVQNAFALGDPYADCDGTGVLDFFDFLCFQNEFARGCG
ncbi:MAG: GC-type dockerin domain-anchored protein, partial [Phycisphaerales bacterium JB039]